MLIVAHRHTQHADTSQHQRDTLSRTHRTFRRLHTSNRDLSIRYRALPSAGIGLPSFWSLCTKNHFHSMRRLLLKEKCGFVAIVPLRRHCRRCRRYTPLLLLLLLVVFRFWCCYCCFHHADNGRKNYGHGFWTSIDCVCVCLCLCSNEHCYFYRRKQSKGTKNKTNE